MDFTLTVLLLVVTGLLLGGPLLALIALLRARELRQRFEGRGSRTTLDDRLARLEVRVDWLDRRLQQVLDAARAGPEVSEKVPERGVAPPAPPAAVEPPAAETGPAAAAPAPPPPPPPAAPARSAFDLESLIAGRVLNRVGIVALLLAVGFFLKFAFDNDWIGPRGRVAIGLVGGALLLAWSEWLLRRAYRYFSEGIAGLGGGVLYLSLYAAWSFYRLIPNGVAFAGMIVVTSALIALAVGRNSERLAFLALVGGFLTPTLLSTGEDAQVVLFSYLLVLNGGLLVLARARRWRALEPVALFWSIAYVAGWHDRFYAAEKLARTLFFYTLLFVEFAALPVLRARRGGRTWPEQIGVVLVNAAWFTVALHVMLYREHRWSLTVAVLVLSAGHLLAARALRDVSTEGPPVSRLLYAGLALTFVTLAIPIRLEGEWITIAWAVEGAVLVWSGLRDRVRALRAAGVLLFLLAVWLMAIDPIEAARLLFNARLGTFAVVIACLLAAFLFSRAYPDGLPREERPVFQGVGISGTVLTVCALSLEVWDFAGDLRLGLDRDLARQLGLSLLWVACAAVLILAGVRLASAALRWQGLVLIAIAVTKVFLFDLSFLERAYRILSFLALGLVLLVVSFLYQRKLAGERSRAGP